MNLLLPKGSHLYDRIPKLIEEHMKNYKRQETLDLLRVIKIMRHCTCKCNRYSRRYYVCICDDVLEEEMRYRFDSLRLKIIGKIEELHATNPAAKESFHRLKVNVIHYAGYAFPTNDDDVKNIKAIIGELETMEEKYGIQKNK